MSPERRQELIRKVVDYDGDPSLLFEEIRHFGWDCETELVTLTADHIHNVLRQYLDGIISARKVSEWANFIERREDIALEEEQIDVLNEIIFWLANPEINYPITEELTHQITAKLNNNVI